MNCDSFLPLIGMTIAARYFYTGYKSCRLRRMYTKAWCQGGEVNVIVKRSGGTDQVMM